MRTHFLKELSISGCDRALAVLPEFDFYNLRRLLRLEWECQESKVIDETTANFVFKALYLAPDGLCFDVTFRCVGVKQLKLPELHAPQFVSEIEVEDVKAHGMEGVCFRIRSYGMQEFEVLTKQLEVIGCTRRPSG